MASLSADVCHSIPSNWFFNRTMHHPAWQDFAAEHGYISAAPTAGGHFVLRLAAYALIFWIAVQSTRNRKRAQHFMRAIALFSGALAFFGLAAAFTGHNPILADTLYPSFVTHLLEQGIS
ncbi:MAG: hypothetical protein EBU18_13325, partial [Rhodobacteraceae bacterium]|nr:hypothetical protein [Paracoccaceae bacterium]